MTAFDDPTVIEVLTYSLSDGPTDAVGHARSFNIDPVTGQITVSAAARLNAEAQLTTDVNNPFAAATPFMVTVRAIDGDGDVEDIVVTINVVGVNEPPRIGADPGEDVVAAREMSHYESDRTARSATEDRHRSGQQCPYASNGDPPTLRYRSKRSKPSGCNLRGNGPGGPGHHSKVVPGWARRRLVHH